MSIAIEWLGRRTWAEGWERQEAILQQHRAGSDADTLLLLEHEPVYTIGRTGDRTSLPLDLTELPAPLVETGRGGKATYHGPGQLVGYCLIDLTRYGQDLHKYLRALEEGLINGCAALGLKTEREEGRTGVWVSGRKLASIGVGARQWVSMHGFAINVCGSLAGFTAITPCGLEGVQMTSLEREGIAEISVASAATHFAPHVSAALGTLQATH